MQLSDVVILSLVQGLTEFLPVSSSGHLVLAHMMLGISDAQGTAFDAFLHLGTLLAVLVYYGRVWQGIVRGLATNDAEGRDKRELAAKLALGTVPGAIVGYALQNRLEGWLASPALLAGGFIVTAVALLASDFLAKPSVLKQRATFQDAFWIGVAQVVALVPAISRSGVTIAAGQARGLSRVQAVRFSFLLSAPIIAGAGLASLSSLGTSGLYAWPQLLVGFIISFLSGWVAIALLLKVVERVSFWPFVIYLGGLAAWLLWV